MIHVPPDLKQRSEFRLLEAKLGADLAARAWLQLWIDLAYSAKTAPLGCVTDRGMSLFRTEFEEADKVVGALTQEGGFLVPEAGAHRCPMFVELNPHLDPRWVPGHLKGNRKSRRGVMLRSYEKNLEQHLVFIPEEVFRRPDGQRMTAELRRRVLVFIRACDLSLDRPDRPQSAEGFPATLVSESLRIVEHYSDTQLEKILDRIAEHRLEDGMPANTEALVAKWAEVQRLLQSLVT